LGEQMRGHVAHEEQAVNGPLVAGEHRVTRARRDGSPFVDVALTVGPERVQQRKRFVCCSVPANPSCHGGRSPLIG
jgi:hypothetical protein